MFKSTLFIFLSPGVCLITVSTAAGVNRHGRVLAVPVMEQDTLEPPATHVSMWVCVYAVLSSCPSVFFPHWNTTVFCSLCVSLIWPSSVRLWVIKLFFLPKPQSSAEGQMNFWSVRGPGFSDCVVCFVLVWEEATRPKAPAHKENKVREREKAEEVFFKGLKIWECHPSSHMPQILFSFKKGWERLVLAILCMFNINNREN